MRLQSKRRCSRTAGMIAAAFASIVATSGPLRAGEPTPPDDSASASTAPAEVSKPSSAPVPLPLPAEDAPELSLYQDIPVVVAAGKREQSQKEAAAAVSVITANDIDLLGYRSLADILGNQRSFYLYTDGLNYFAGVRGFNRAEEWNARILVTVDGRPTREPLYSQSHIDQDFVVPPEAMKQVEIVRGPGSALYGTGAMFGVVNVVTKDGADINGLQVRAQGGTESTVRGSVLWGTVLPGDWDVMFALTGYDSQGNTNLIYDGIHDQAHNFGHIRDSDFEGVESALLKVRKGELTATFDFETRQKGNPTATYLTSWYDPGNMHEIRGNITLKWDHDVAPGQSLHAMAYYGHYIYNQLLPYDSLGGGQADRYHTTGQDAWIGEEIHYDWQISKTVHFLAGADGSETLFTRQKDYDTLGGVLLDIPASYSTWGLFSEVEWKPVSWLALTAGGRFDHVQRVGGSTSPRFAAIVTPNQTDTFKALYGRAFRAPNLYELVYAQPGLNEPNPNLKSEVADTYELLWEHQYHNGWQTTLDGFYWNMNNAMDNVTLPDGALQVRNKGTAFAYGAETEVRKQWQNGASARGYATLTWGRQDGAELSLSPHWIVGGSVLVPVLGHKLYVAVTPQFVGSMHSDTGDRSAPTFVTNVVLTSKDFIKGWDLQAGAYNLFADNARFPRGGTSIQFEPTLNYPSTQYLVQLTHRF